MKLETLETRGTPKELGRAHGEYFRERIRAFIAMRFDAVRGYLRDRGSSNFDQLSPIAAASAEIHRGFHPVGYEEHLGIAAGANVDAIELYLATQMTDMRDALLLSAARGVSQPPTPDDGCTSVLVPSGHTTSGMALVAQTWDLNPPDVDYVVAIRRKPNEGPETWAITCVGCLSMMGINDHGIAVGTTNIKTYGSRPGVGYLGLLHRMLTSSTIEGVERAVTSAPLAGAHTYWAGTATEQIEWEATPKDRVRRDTRAGAIFRSNHCLVPSHQAIEGETPTESSRKRFARVGEILARVPIDIESMKALFADRSDGVFSINRYAEDDQGTATNAVFIAEPANRRAFACRGPADRGTFIELRF